MAKKPRGALGDAAAKASAAAELVAQKQLAKRKATARTEHTDAPVPQLSPSAAEPKQQPQSKSTIRVKSLTHASTAHNAADAPAISTPAAGNAAEYNGTAASLKPSKPRSHVGSKDMIPLDGDATTPSSSRGGDEQSNVVYIGHLPHGFYEKQLLGFFSQFGKLTRIRLSRNKKTGKAKHYAFLEFQYPEVARIAADTMDGYFMFAQKLCVRCLKQTEVHPELFKGGNRKFKNIPWRRIAMERVNKDRTPAEHAKRIARLVVKDRRRQRKIAAAGIDFEYEGLAGRLPVKPKKTLFS